MSGRAGIQQGRFSALRGFGIVEPLLVGLQRLLGLRFELVFLLFSGICLTGPGFRCDGRRTYRFPGPAAS